MAGGTAAGGGRGALPLPGPAQLWAGPERRARHPCTWPWLPGTPVRGGGSAHLLCQKNGFCGRDAPPFVCWGSLTFSLS